VTEAVTEPLPTERAALLARLAEPRVWDVAVVGGGASGLGVALDAAARGLSVVLLESHDFAKGTSSRATKLLHGGVRYLAQGNLSLVREALHERATILRNAPHLSQPLAFVMPAYRWWEAPFYGLGLKAYDRLAGDAGLGATEWLGAAGVRAALPNVRTEGLRGGVRYWDAQFDDARLALALARTAAAQGALLVNHCAVTAVLHDAGRVSGLTCEDRESGASFRVQARCVINATGVWVDELRQREPGAAAVRPLVAPSQGVHLVVDADFLPGQQALLVPRTRDGRVLFAVPWLGKVILGTTDTPRADTVREPQPFADEVDFILREAADVLARAPRAADVRSCWVGLRPLVRPEAAGEGGAGSAGGGTAGISREHLVQVSPGGLVTVTGGKWTTYRSMARDVLRRCAAEGLIATGARGINEVTANLPLVGATTGQAPQLQGGWAAYGSEGDRAQALPGADAWLADGLSEAMVRFAARHEYARTVEDVLARRSRLLFLDAAAAARAAPAVARVLAEETGRDPQAQAFTALAQAWAGAAARPVAPAAAPAAARPAGL